MRLPVLIILFTDRCFESQRSSGLESVDLFTTQEKSSQRFSERFDFFMKGVPGFEERITEDDGNDLGNKDFYNLCNSGSSLGPCCLR